MPNPCYYQDYDRSMLYSAQSGSEKRWTLKMIPNGVGNVLEDRVSNGMGLTDSMKRQEEWQLELDEMTR